MKLKKILASILCIAMVLSTMSFAVFAEATVHEVANDAELADALKSAVDGDTIKLAPGEYTGGIRVGKNITLEGSVDADGNPTTVFCKDSGSGHYDGAIRMGKGTIKNIKITDAWKGIVASGKGNLTIDNVTTVGIGYAIHVNETRNAEDTIIVQNCNIDVTWACSFTGGPYTLIVKNNVFTSNDPYYPDAGAAAVNSYVTNTTIEDNYFDKNAKIAVMADYEVGTNYYVDGVENALHGNGKDDATVDTYYADEEMAVVKKTPKGTLNSCRVNVDNADRTFITTELNTVYAEESIKLEILDADGNVLATTLSTDKVFEDITFPTGSLSIFTGINSTDDYWTTTWTTQMLRGDIEPDKAILYVDGIKTSEIDFVMKGATSNKDIVWSEVSGVFNPNINGVYLAGSYDNAYLCVEVYDFYLDKTFETKYFSKGEHIATVSLNEGMLTSGAKESIGCCLGFNGDFDEYWHTEWIVAPNAEQVPDKVEIYVDGVKITEKNGPFRNGIKGWDPDSNGNWLYELISEDWAKIDGVFTAAKVGEKSYSSIQAAVNAAEEGSIIEVVNNVEITSPVIIDKNLTINGNSFSAKVKDIPSGRAKAAFEVKDNAVVTFKNIDIAGGSVVDENGAISEGKAGAAIVATNATVNVVDSNLIGGSAAGVSMVSAAAAIKAVGATINITDSTLTGGESQEIPAPVIDIEDTSKLSITNAVLNYKTTSHPEYPKSIDVISDFEGYEYTQPIEMSGKVVINGRTFDKVSIKVPEGKTLFLEGDIATDKITLEANYEFDRTANGYAVVPTEKLADTISIVYKDVTEPNTEGEKTYAIVVKANEGDEIHELASVDLSFVFTEAPIANGDITFTVAPVAKFALTEHDSTVREELNKRYMFNYNGVDAFEGNGPEITVGTITVTGYGSFTIATADVDTNIVNATTVNDNLVDSYTAAGATDNDNTTGGLDISDIVDGDEAVIAVPTRTLTINLDFPNAINGNAAAYQDMKVEITGNIDGVNKTVAYDLGETNNNGGYVVTNNALVLNNAYTVTVSGAGYRTARYTVTMTDDKTLRFWNNVMDEAQVVEIGKDSSVAKVTFLAGDIVKDNNINIYDLSAVVSYFGTEDCVNSYPEYAKYDLNRDSVIDSKDVAYVLVSWNN